MRSAEVGMRNGRQVRVPWILTLLILLVGCGSAPQAEVHTTQQDAYDCELIAQPQAAQLLQGDTDYESAEAAIVELYNLDVNEIDKDYYELGQRFEQALRWTRGDVAYTAKFTDNKLLNVQALPYADSSWLTAKNVTDCLGKPDFYIQHPLVSSHGTDNDMMKMMFLEEGRVISLVGHQNSDFFDSATHLELVDVQSVVPGPVEEVVTKTTWGPSVLTPKDFELLKPWPEN
jgi:hypothetical protein